MNYTKHKFWIGILLGIFVISIFGIFEDFSALKRSFTLFEWSYLPLILCLTFSGYLLRFWKWDMLLQTIGIRISVKKNLLIFLSGMSMAITPGKAGELIKSFLLKSSEKVDIARTAPVVLTERITDLFAMIFLAIWGVVHFSNGAWILAFTFLLLTTGILLMKNRMFAQGTLLKLKKYTTINKILVRLEVLYDSSSQLLHFRTLLYTTLISTASWFLECLSFYFVLQGFDLNLRILDAIFVFSFSSIAGAVSMIPGGLGVTEASMTGLMIGLGIVKSKAIAATLMGRFTTLWFGVIIGTTVLLVNQKKWRS